MSGMRICKLYELNYVKKVHLSSGRENRSNYEISRFFLKWDEVQQTGDPKPQLSFWI